MRVEVDRSKCRGHGQCVSVAPNVFEMGDDDRSHVRLAAQEEVPPEDEGRVSDAVAMCPEAAISWVDSPPASRP
jgi:ferredoxin